MFGYAPKKMWRPVSIQSPSASCHAETWSSSPRRRDDAVELVVFAGGASQSRERGRAEGGGDRTTAATARASEARPRGLAGGSLQDTARRRGEGGRREGAWIPERVWVLLRGGEERASERESARASE